MNSPGQMQSSKQYSSWPKESPSMPKAILIHNVSEPATWSIASRNRLTRYLYDGRGLHGHQQSSQLRLRGWALLRNFTPYAPRSNQQRNYSSPAHSLNQKVYHHHWLHNLNISASLAGFRNSCT